MPAGILELHLACQKVSCQVNDWDLWMCSQKQSPAQGLCYRNLLHLTSQNRKKQTHLLSKGFSPLTYFTIWGLPAPPSLLLSICLLASNSTIFVPLFSRRSKWSGTTDVQQRPIYTFISYFFLSLYKKTMLDQPNMSLVLLEVSFVKGSFLLSSVAMVLIHEGIDELM